jgi:arylformamidase
VRIIDLSLTVVPASCWVQFPRTVIGGKWPGQEPPTRIETISTVAERGFFVQRFETCTQSYTHVDAPAHIFEDGLTNDQIPLDRLVGEAVVIDMMHKQPKEAVTAADLEASGVEVREGDIVIIRTGWTDRAWATEEFWRDMIVLSEDACDWLIGKGIKALVQDFDPDVQLMYTCEACGALRPREVYVPNHHKFLERGIILIEWCTNLGAIEKPRVTLVCLPLKLKDSDGAPARVIAIEEE